MNIKEFLNKLIYGGGVFFDLTKWLIVIVIVFILLNTFWISVFVVDGLSMEPYLHDRELVLWNPNSYDKTEPGRGDIIVMNYPGDPKHKKYVKRIVGLPNERVDIYDGHVYIDKKILSEDYLYVDTETDPPGTWQLGADQYFVLGDNRPGSSDSRYFGAVERRFILGRALSVVYPRIWIIRDM